MKFCVRVFLSEIASHITTWGGGPSLPHLTPHLSRREHFVLFQSAHLHCKDSGVKFKGQFSLACYSTLIIYYVHRMALHTLLVVIDFAFTVYTLWIINCPVRCCLCICTYCLCIPNASSIFAWITSHEFRTIFGTRISRVFVIKSVQTHKINSRLEIFTTCS